MGKKAFLTVAAALLAAPLIVAGSARANSVLQVNFYTHANDIEFPDPTIRVTNYSGADRCALYYVTNEDQEMRECCGCEVTEGGLQTTSLSELTENPDNAVPTDTGSIALLSSAVEEGPAGLCDPGTPALNPQLEAWTTHSEQFNSGEPEETESEFTPVPLSGATLNSLVSQCQAIELVGSGPGICECGTLDNG